ncbi:hypothetical protein L914_00333 [Phytophthora nicotianae]|uniref:Uncharacterized protein n=1 Tax=Phytophthora nicotianae TaxID=4792 RepID=W2P978_PHYNI|nr:hypothetical protein L914_00333 [Phytophthora nicotianae]
MVEKPPMVSLALDTAGVMVVLMLGCVNLVPQDPKLRIADELYAAYVVEYENDCFYDFSEHQQHVKVVSVYSKKSVSIGDFYVGFRETLDQE